MVHETLPKQKKIEKISAFTKSACFAFILFFFLNQKMSPEETIVLFMATEDTNLKQSKTHTHQI
jgi:hypothetical protein